MVELKQINPKNQDVLLQPSQIKKQAKNVSKRGKNKGTSLHQKDKQNLTFLRVYSQKLVHI